MVERTYPHKYLDYSTFYFHNDYMSLTKAMLLRSYIKEKKSAKDIGTACSCSEHKVNYWMNKYEIPKRSMSEAMYAKYNPNGDPFLFKKPHTQEEAFLFGLGLGLYWGEGTKKNLNTVRLGNSDPNLVKAFLEFLIRCYSVEESKFRFALQVFSDMSPEKTLDFWCRSLGVSKSQFSKTIITPSGSLGTYREKSKYGVLTVYVCNTKLRNIICGEVEKLQEQSMLKTLFQKPT